MAVKNYENDLTNGPLLKKIILFAIPLMLTSMLQLLYNAADVVVVGAFAGDESLAAVGSTGSLTNLIIQLFMGMATGTGVIIAQAIGERNLKRLHNTVHTAMTMSVIIGIAVGIFGYFCSNMFLTFMDTPDDVLPKATLYMQIYFMGLPALMVYNFGAAIIRATGDTKRPLIILGLSGLVNVFLNLIFVIVLHMDVAGVALATIISQYLSAGAIVIKLLRDDTAYKLDLSELKINKKALFEVIRYGVPMGIQGSMFSISNVIIQSSINSFGSVVMAGNSAAQSLDGFIFAAADSGAQAAMTFSGQNTGAKKFDRVRKSLFLCIGLSTVMAILFGGIVMLFERPLLSVYTDTADAIDAGSIRLNIMCVWYFTCGIMNTISNTVRGMGKNVVPMIISMFFVCVFRIIWIYTVFPIEMFHTPDTIYWSYPISWLLAIVAHSIYFEIVFRQKKKTAV